MRFRTGLSGPGRGESDAPPVENERLRPLGGTILVWSSGYCQGGEKTEAGLPVAGLTTVNGYRKLRTAWSEPGKQARTGQSSLA